MVFGLDSMEVLDISTRKLIVEGVANHASKQYEFSHFLPYSDLVPSQLPFEREYKFILPKPFSYDDVSINVSYSESKAEDQVETIFGIEDKVQIVLDLDPIPTPNPRSKWAQNVTEAARNMIGESSNMRRTRS